VSLKLQLPPFYFCPIEDGLNSAGREVGVVRLQLLVEANSVLGPGSFHF
jgi:hypothetical protein